MAWIDASAVEPLLRQDLSADAYLPDLIAHVQGLIELEVGTVPVDATSSKPSASIQAVTAQIVARMYRETLKAEANPTDATLQQAGPFSMQQASSDTSRAGLGLTNREIDLLNRALGKQTGFWIQPTSRGDLLTAGPETEVYDELDPIEQVVSTQSQITR